MAPHDLHRSPSSAAAGTGPGVRSASRRELGRLSAQALRHRRQMLAAELRRARHWARLVRARKDLLVAGAVAVEELEVPAEAASRHGPLDAYLNPDGFPADLPDPGLSMAALVLGGAQPQHPAALNLADTLRDLSLVGDRLESYLSALQAEYELVTSFYVRRCSALWSRSHMGDA